MIVLGAGVSGLTTAVLLAETGRVVQVLAASLPPETTSNVAAAFWYPYRTLPSDRAVRWSVTSYRRFTALCDDPAAGVSMARAFDFARSPLPRPWWGDAVRNLTPLLRGAGPQGFDHGWGFDAPIIDTRVYLPWLVARLEAAGGRLEVREVASFEALPAGETIINCCGLGARGLTGDTSLHPVRGQLVHVENPGLSEVLLDEHDGGGIAYAVPRGDHVVLGGTATDHDADLDVRPHEAAAIMQRCGQLDPRLATATRLRDVVGLRPGRPDVRLESEVRGSQRIIHNYGHGGAGVTLSWGCALDVRALMDTP